jgi:hypothetical protein
MVKSTEADVPPLYELPLEWRRQNPYILGLKQWEHC